jgi:hypothetical protein
MSSLPLAPERRKRRGAIAGMSLQLESAIRETRERWLLLTVETEATGSTNEGLPWLVRWACRAGSRNFCPELAALLGPGTKYFFPRLFIYPRRPASWAGLRAVRLS